MVTNSWADPRGGWDGYPVPTVSFVFSHFKLKFNLRSLEKFST